MSANIPDTTTCDITTALKAALDALIIANSDCIYSAFLHPKSVASIVEEAKDPFASKATIDRARGADAYALYASCLGYYFAHEAALAARVTFDAALAAYDAAFRPAPSLNPPPHDH